MSDETVGPPYRLAYTVTVDTLLDASRLMTAWTYAPAEAFGSATRRREIVAFARAQIASR